jgi:replicative DNA helicase
MHVISKVLLLPRGPTERATTGFVGLKDLVYPFMENLEKVRRSEALVTGLPTGIAKLDELTLGLQPSNLILVAGRPGQGKTALALNVLSHVGLRLKMPVAFFSLEMDKESLVLRLISAEAGIDGQALRRGYLKPLEGSGARGWEAITQAASRFLDCDVYIDDTSFLNTLDLRSRARRLVGELQAKDKKLGLVIVDYLQMLQVSDRRENRQQDVAEISRSLKALAKDLGVPVVALSQLSRRPEDKGREGGRPQLADLRDSGALEQDADLVLFVYREALGRPNTSPEERAKAELIIGKQRNGPLGTVYLTFLERFTRFVPAEFPQEHGAGTDEETVSLG